ncbi:hypothetical protein ED033_01510 [Salmonella enterica]|uniref:Uncharacterized protein n=1 Tax=Salmonella enterica TaxID=28901 RepID=A0A3I8H3H1_SALER|nr:hypothetical protein [Salmonella enterica]
MGDCFIKNLTVLMLRTNSSLCGISSPLCDFYSASATRFIGSLKPTLKQNSLVNKDEGDKITTELMPQR